MPDTIRGIHHVTAIATDPQTNLDFYAGVLGLRLVKRTVNFDDPGTYHFYYGDETGQPGTILTFFPWPGALQGRSGTGQVTATAFAIRPDSLGYWLDRLRSRDIAVEGPITRFGEEVVTFADPDGLRLELVAGPDTDSGPAWGGGPVTETHSIRGFHSVTLAEAGGDYSAWMLGDVMDFLPVAQEGQRVRYRMGEPGPGTVVDMLRMNGVGPGHISAGSVHHVAWRVDGDDSQARWRERIAKTGIAVTPVRDRQYFRSIYFREPGGVLFEIATDPPGFTWDEDPATLGMQLKLPPWLEAHRADLEAQLPPITLPDVG